LRLQGNANPRHQHETKSRRAERFGLLCAPRPSFQLLGSTHFFRFGIHTGKSSIDVLAFSLIGTAMFGEAETQIISQLISSVIYRVGLTHPPLCDVRQNLAD